MDIYSRLCLVVEINKLHKGYYLWQDIDSKKFLYIIYIR